MISLFLKVASIVVPIGILFLMIGNLLGECDKYLEVGNRLYGVGCVILSLCVAFGLSLVVLELYKIIWYR